MSKFKPGDRVRHSAHATTTAVILGVHKDQYWVEYNGNEYLSTRIGHIDRYYELVPESFLPNGDQYINILTEPKATFPHPALWQAEVGIAADEKYRVGIIRVDGQTGELSWAKGGPK